MEKVYFIGINGIGMSGIAKIMKTKGYCVEGADICRNYVTDELLSLGIKVFDEHVANRVKDVDFVVASSAIKENNPEYDYAIKNNIKILKRGELLAKLLNENNGIAIAGTHGKTTTTSMLSSMMLKLDPTIVVGGILPEINSNAKAGKSDFFIAEADESDNSFLYMKPKYSIVTNIDSDHLDVHKNLENIKKSFKQFILNTEKEVILCEDCENIKTLINEFKKNDSKILKNIITYSIINKHADIFADNIVVKDKKTYFDLYIKGEKIDTFCLNIPGNHNVLNAICTIYLALNFGVNKEEINSTLCTFKGSKRRYDILFDGKIDENKNINVRIIDDYAHHPTEIKATIKAAKSIENGRLVCIFQPHRYSRINFILENFKSSFDLADKLILLPIYSAGEKNIYNISEEILLEKINHKNSEIMKDFKDVKKYIKKVKQNSTYLFMGAGNISSLVKEFVEEIKNDKENLE